MRNQISKTLRISAPKIAILSCTVMCACSGNITKLEKDVHRLESKLNDLRNFQAEQTSEIASVQTRLRNLTGRLEEVEYRHHARHGTDIKDLKSDISALKRRVPPPAIVPELALEQDEVLAERLKPGIANTFSTALADIRGGRFPLALPKLREAYDLNFGKEGSAQILFWMAVAYDGMGDSKKALRTYNDLVSGFPKHPRSALGLLRLGSVFIRLGDSQTAKLTFRKLISEFPKSSAASRARERLKDL